MAQNRLNGNKDGNGFDNNPENINRKGRPRKLISDVIVTLEAQGYKETNKAEITAIYLRLINTDIEELELIKDDKKQPALVSLIAKAILADKGFDIIEKMLDRSIGKAQSNLDITGDIKMTTDPFKQIRENAGIDTKAETSD